jgi:hypothetical protein
VESKSTINECFCPVTVTHFFRTSTATEPVTFLMEQLTFYCKLYKTFGATTDIRRLTTVVLSAKCVVRQFRRCANVIVCTYMRRLTTAIRSEKCVFRHFRRCANVIVCTDMRRLTTVILSEKCVVKIGRAHV